jgi:secondary thiamine-phosphate synthase enzyme
MRTAELSIDTSARRMVDLTADVRAFAESSSDGLVHVFVPHATAGLALMETGSGSEEDLEDALERLLPRDNRYRHAHGSRGHGADHLLPAFLAPSLSVPVVGGRLMLGTWQSVVLVDPNRDNRERRVILSFLES